MAKRQKKLTELQNRWNEVCNAYLKEFCKKHGFICADGWVGDDVGTIAIIGDFFVNIIDMRYDIDNNVDKDKFLLWYDYTSNIAMLGLERTINYPSFCKGAPLPYTEEEIAEIEILQERVREAEKKLYEAMEDLRSEKKSRKNKKYE